MRQLGELRESSVIEGVRHLTFQRHEDDRGSFTETFRAEWFPGSVFVQGNLSSSRSGVLRGLHYHLAQEDFWTIPRGRAWVALVDLRAASDTYLAVESFELGGSRGLHIPAGVAHGFYAPEETLMSYLVTAHYDGSDELGVAWDDPELAVPWPVEEPILSERDRKNPRWREVPEAERP